LSFHPRSAAWAPFYPNSESFGSHIFSAIPQMSSLRHPVHFLSGDEGICGGGMRSSGDLAPYLSVKRVNRPLKRWRFPGPILQNVNRFLTLRSRSPVGPTTFTGFYP
jgi:hypothetical protein